MRFCTERGVLSSIIFRKKSKHWFALSTDDTCETLESLAIHGGRSMLAIFLNILYVVGELGHRR